MPLRVRVFLFVRKISHMARLRVATLLVYVAGWGRGGVGGRSFR